MGIAGGLRSLFGNLSKLDGVHRCLKRMFGGEAGEGIVRRRIEDVKKVVHR